MPLTLFRNPTFSLMLVISLMSGAVGIGMVNYFALFLQTTTGLTPSVAGLLFILLTGGIVVGSLTAGRLISLSGRYKPFAIVSASLTVLALLIFTQIQPGTPLFVICGIMALHGIGIGLRPAGSDRCRPEHRLPRGCRGCHRRRYAVAHGGSLDRHLHLRRHHCSKPIPCRRHHPRGQQH